MRPVRPCPDEFVEVYTELKSVRACMPRFRASHRVIRGWAREKGLPIFNQRQQKERKPPVSLRLLARVRSIAELKRELRAGHARLQQWIGAEGIDRTPLTRRPASASRVMDPVRRALRHLRQFHDTFDGGETYAAINGKRFVVGRRRMTEEEMLELARLYGWRG